MDANLQAALSIAVPTFAVLLSTLFNSARFNDLRGEIDARFRAQDEKWDTRLRAHDEKWDERFKGQDEKWDARLKGQDDKWEARFVAVHAQFGAVNVRLDSLNQHLTDTREVLRSEIKRVEGVLDERLKHLQPAP